MGNVNLNFFDIKLPNFRNDVLADFSPTAVSDVNDILSDIFKGLGNLFTTLGSNQSQNSPGIMPGGCCLPPVPENSSHPSGSMKTDNGVITTPGGYKIEPLGKFEWKVTGPDGKETRVWGDPHVAEGDGGKWDFKRNSTFVLGDGTRINVNTAPYGDKGMTVTSSLEVISGNDRVTVSGIDKGKGVIGDITHDGYAHSNSFSGDVFVMGRETDDWSFQGREITGSKNGGESFELGNQLPVGRPNLMVPQESDWASKLKDLVKDLTGNWNETWRPNNIGSNPYYDGLSSKRRPESAYNRRQHLDQLSRAFHLLGRAFSILERYSSLNDRMNISRNRTMYA